MLGTHLVLYLHSLQSDQQANCLHQITECHLPPNNPSLQRRADRGPQVFVRWMLRRKIGLGLPTSNQSGRARSGLGQKVSQLSSFGDAGLMANFVVSEGTLGAVASLACEGLKAGARGAERKAEPRPALDTIDALARSADRAAPRGEVAGLLPSPNTDTVCTSSCAWALRLLAAAAISSTNAAFC